MIGTVVKHEPGDRLTVSVNGRFADPLAFESTVANRQRGIAVSRWKNLPVVEGTNVIRVDVRRPDNSLVETLERQVHYASRPIRAELVAERSYLVADGVQTPVIAVRLTDRQGFPARPGVSGEFSEAPRRRPLGAWAPAPRLPQCHGRDR